MKTRRFKRQKVSLELSLPYYGLHFLRERYGARKGDRRLIEMAIAEIVKSEAEKSLSDLAKLKGEGRCENACNISN